MSRTHEWVKLVEKYRDEIFKIEEKEVLQVGKHVRTVMDAGRYSTSEDGEAFGAYCAAEELERQLVKEQYALLGVQDSMDRVCRLGKISDRLRESVELIFTKNLRTERDSVLTKLMPMKASLIPEIIRNLYSKQVYQVIISLPWWICANEYERDAELHKALCHFSDNIVSPALRKPDITQFAENLALYGARDYRELRAVVVAHDHPDTRARCREFEFDALRQGWLFGIPEPQELVDLRAESKKSVKEQEEGKKEKSKEKLQVRVRQGSQKGIIKEIRMSPVTA